jgi:uncharacterized protein YkwD
MNRTIFPILILLCASSCAVKQSSSVLTSEQQTSTEETILAYVNQYRQSQNLSPLIAVDTFDQIAREHSGDMQSSDKMDHNGFSGRASMVQNRYPQASVAENVGFNQGFSMPEKHMVDSWIKSPGHQRNIVGNYIYSGIGVTKSAEGKIFYTQIFVNP